MSNSPTGTVIAYNGIFTNTSATNATVQNVNLTSVSAANAGVLVANAQGQLTTTQLNGLTYDNSSNSLTVDGGSTGAGVINSPIDSSAIPPVAAGSASPGQFESYVYNTTQPLGPSVLGNLPVFQMVIPNAPQGTKISMKLQVAFDALGLLGQPGAGTVNISAIYLYDSTLINGTGAAVVGNAVITGAGGILLNVLVGGANITQVGSLLTVNLATLASLGGVGGDIVTQADIITAL